MPKLIPPARTINGNKAIGGEWAGYAEKQLRILERQMALAKPKPLNEGYRRVSPVPWIVVECWSSFKCSELVITVLEKSVPVYFDMPRKPIEVPYMKVFVHVDMINTTPGAPPTENWWFRKDGADSSIIDGDEFARAMVTSAVAGGIVSLADGSLISSAVKIPTRIPTGGSDTSTEYLAANNAVSPWQGIYGSSTYSTPLEVMGYYNDLFPDGATLPETMTRWLDKDTLFYTSLSGYTTPTWHNAIDVYDYYSWKRIIPAPTGWCDDIILRDSTSSFTVLEPGDNQYFRWVSYNNYRFSLFGSETPEYHCTLLTGGQFQQKYTGYYEYRTDHFLNHPVLGTVFPINIYHGDTTIPPLTTNTEIRPIRRNSSIPINYIWKYDWDTYDWMSDIYKMDDTDITQNYYDNNGFIFYAGTFGGMSIDYTRVDESTYYDYNFSCKTLMNLCVAAGMSITPWEDRTFNPINGSVRELAKQAIEFLGGTVYDNSTIRPEHILEQYSIDEFEEHAGITYVDPRTLPGLLYSSPLYNIRVYAMPAITKVN